MLPVKSTDRKLALSKIEDIMLKFCPFLHKVVDRDAVVESEFISKVKIMLQTESRGIALFELVETKVYDNAHYMFYVLMHALSGKIPEQKKLLIQEALDNIQRQGFNLNALSYMGGPLLLAAIAYDEQELFESLIVARD